jgi:hypothetical protein
VVFYFNAANLPGANGTGQIYLRDATGGLKLVSSSDGGTTGGNGNSIEPQINASGQVVFGSSATDLPSGTGSSQVYLWSPTHEVSYSYDGTVPVGAPAVPTSAAAAVNHSVAVATAPTFEDYSFSGWTTTDVTVTGDSFTMPNNAVAFSGTWTKIPPAPDTLDVARIFGEDRHATSKQIAAN